jgi:cell division protease FtsH
MYLGKNTVNYLEYKEKLDSYNSYPNYVALQNKVYGPTKNISMNDAVNIIGKNKIETVEFILDGGTYAKVNIVLKENFVIHYQNVLPFSISNNIEPFLIKENIPYLWSTGESKYQNKIYEPTLKKSELIPEFVQEHALQFLLYGFILFYLMKSMPGLGSKKFEVIHPEKIKGSFNDLVGMDPEIKLEILQLKDLILNKQLYSNYGLENVFNIAFSGPAGTGKSRTALYLSKELDLPMVIGTGNVETGFVGGGAGTIKAIFSEAEILAYESPLKTSIIFLDEAQTLFVKRGNSREKWADDAANELLAQLDGINSMRDINIIFIAASNFDETNMSIDEAMERRFKKKIYFKLPGQPERKEILEYYMNRIDDELKGDVNFDYIASITTGLSPAKIETVINEASLIAIRENAKIDLENELADKNNSNITIKDHVTIDTNLLFKAFERISIGMTNRDESKPDRKRIILHELGHFICEFERYYNEEKDLSIVKEKMKFLKISSESISKFGALGYVLSSDSDNKLNTRLDIEEEIIALYGGYAAESIYFSNGDNSLVSTGAYNDIEKVSKLLKLVVIELGMYSKSKVNFNIIGLKNDESFVSDIEKLSEELFNKSSRRVSKNKELINYLEGFIFDKWVLSKDEIFELIVKFKSKEQ